MFKREHRLEEQAQAELLACKHVFTLRLSLWFLVVTVLE